MESFLRKKLIVGLGNPTRRYKKTRHNLGFMVLDYLAKLNRIKFRKDKSTKAMTCKTFINDKLVILAKPMTYMNLSGEAVALLKKNLAIKQEDMLIIQDDIDLELGKLRIKKNSSSGGHKGIASIINSLNSDKFCRLKIGIGRPKDNNISLVDYLLSNFTKQEYAKLKEKFPVIKEAIFLILQDKLKEAMDKYNA